MSDGGTASTADRRIGDIAGTEVLLVALDVDGTLAPLMDDPMAVRIVPEARAAIDRLAALPATIVAYVSGRSLDALRVITEHGDDSPIHLAGSHGAEAWRPGIGDAESAGAPAGVEDIRVAAEAAIADSPLARIEQKTLGLALHTRGAAPADAERARVAVTALMAERAPHWRVRDGKDVREFSWRHEGKDAALARLRSETGATAVVFAGDDVTDEDAIASLSSHDLGIRVGGGVSAAAVHVADPAELAELLDVIACRRAVGAQ